LKFIARLEEHVATEASRDSLWLPVGFRKCCLRAPYVAHLKSIVGRWAGVYLSSIAFSAETGAGGDPQAKRDPCSAIRLLLNESKGSRIVYRLAVDRRELLSGLRRFIRADVWPSQKAAIGFDGRFFSIKAANRVIVAHARGTWPGVAYVRSNAILAIALAPPDGEPVRVSCDGKRLRTGSFSVVCAWQPVSMTLLSLPGVPDWLEALSREYRSGRTQACVQGRTDRRVVKSEQQLASLISNAAKSLAALGITEQDVRSLIESRLARRKRRKTDT
jgi:hypothetical protein